MRRSNLNPTFIGLFAVLVWGLSVPLIKYVQQQIGILGWPVTTFTTMALFGFANQVLGKQSFAGKKVFRNPYFYGRWFFFILNLIGIWTAVTIVRKQFIPFVILLNYLWPTFIILCSIMLAGVAVTRRVVFAIGTLIVIMAIGIEVLSPDMVTSDLFAEPLDRIGYLCAVIGSFSWGMYSALSKRAGHETGGSSVLPIFQISVGLGALPASLVPGWTAWNNMTLALVGILVIWCVLNFLAYLTWDIGMRKGNVVLLSLFADFTPWLSLIASHFILGIDIGQKTVLSAVLLVVGATTTRYGTLPKTLKQAQKSKNLPPVQPPAD